MWEILCTHFQWNVISFLCICSLGVYISLCSAFACWIRLAARAKWPLIHITLRSCRAIMLCTSKRSVARVSCCNRIIPPIIIVSRYYYCYIQEEDWNKCYSYRDVRFLNIPILPYFHIALITQNGFWKGRSCMDCIFTLTRVVEKRREFTNIHSTCWLGKGVWKSKGKHTVESRLLFERGVHLIRALQSLYVGSKIIIGESCCQEYALINSGVRQGCPLSPARLTYRPIREGEGNYCFTINNTLLNRIFLLTIKQRLLVMNKYNN